MRERKILGIGLDVWGFSGSFLCAIHCLALPFLVSMGLLGHLHLHATFVWEWILFVVLLLIAIGSLIGSFRKSHRDAGPLLMAGLGIALIFIGTVNHEHFSHFMSGIGGLILAAAHFQNWRLLHRRKRRSIA